MLRCFGIEITCQSGRISLYGGQNLKSTELHVPADLSAAAFFMVAGCIAKRACLTLSQVGINPSRLGIIHLLRRMGAKIQLHDIRWFNNEPIADITVQTSQLTAISVNADEVALAIDELPIFCIAAACATGKTMITGAAELRYKESDRIKAMVKGLANLGIKTKELTDGLIIEGGTLQGGIVDSAGDHRIAMAFSMAAAVAMRPIRVINCANVATSLPNFVQLANQIGFNIRSVSEETAMMGGINRLRTTS
jgi:3-phosphoshikimate 1-carboxyvinyltransferase